MVDVVIPTKKTSPFFDASIDSLKYIPFPYKLHLITKGTSWAEAINIGFGESENDVLIMDDDTILEPDTFRNFKPIGDITGFKLRGGDGKINHAGSYVEISDFSYCNAPVSPYFPETPDIVINCHAGFGHLSEDITEPIEVPHCTASLLYIKKNVWQKLHGIATDYPGYQYEDVDFSFRALKEGFKIVCLPNEAIHHLGATKGSDPNFPQKMSVNLKIITRKFFSDPEFIGLLYKRGLVNGHSSIFTNSDFLIK